MELIKTIALLCQLQASKNLEAVEKKQLQCQQYYVKCLDNPLNANYKTLSKCIKEKK
jgi:hypothetical protein